MVYFILTCAQMFCHLSCVIIVVFIYELCFSLFVRLNYEGIEVF